MHWLMMAFAVLVFVSFFMATMWLGSWVEHRAIAKAEGKSPLRSPMVETAMFTLLGLMLAFSFSAAWSRFDARLRYAVDEATAVQNVALRVELLPAENQRRIKQSLGRYIDLRLADNKTISSPTAQDNALLNQEKLVLAREAAAIARIDPGTGAVLLSSMDSLFEKTSAEKIEAQTYIPELVTNLLFWLSLICSFVVGRELAGQKRAMLRFGLLYAVSVATTIYVIIDLADPRIGLIQITSADAQMLEARASLDESKK